MNAIKSLTHIQFRSFATKLQERINLKGDLPVTRKPLKIPNVSKVFAVASGKGGVGKSTTTVNLAFAFAQLGKSVGILDADLFGPSVPRMLGLSGSPSIVNRDEIEKHVADQMPENVNSFLKPHVNYGIQAMSMGFLVPEDQPLVWRGLMITKALDQLCRQVYWSPKLDLLLVDLPPGTGDTQISLAQIVQLDGALIVTTPQEVAVSVALRGAAMFKKVNVNVLGVVENMSHLNCPCCSNEIPIFTTAKKEKSLEARLKEQDLSILARIPIDPSIAEFADQGQPLALINPESNESKAYLNLANSLLPLI